MNFVLLAIGLVLVIEGLAVALAPSRMEDVLAALARIPPEKRRLFGLAALAAGIAMIWVARRLGL